MIRVLGRREPGRHSPRRIRYRDRPRKSLWDWDVFPTAPKFFGAVGFVGPLFTGFAIYDVITGTASWLTLRVAAIGIVCLTVSVLWLRRPVEKKDESA